MATTGLMFFALIALVFLFVGAAVFQWLWNITMPETFDLKQIRYWVAFRLLLISAFITSGGFININGAQ